MKAREGRHRGRAPPRSSATCIAMPQTMRRLAWVQIFTWLGLFCMWLYFGVAVARNIFGGTPGTPAYEPGIAWGGNCFAMYSVVCFLFSFALPTMAERLGRKLTHALCLARGRRRAALGGVHPHVSSSCRWSASASPGPASSRCPTRSWRAALPPEKTGIYMGIFNFFIVIPEILAALVFGRIMERSSRPTARWCACWAATTGSRPWSSAASAWRWPPRSVLSSSSPSPPSRR